MCELLGVTAKRKIEMNRRLEEFFRHSVEHRNGWGMVLFDQSPITVKKEALRAIDSRMLAQIMHHSIKTSGCIAHIRKATIGAEELKNTHPFSKSDRVGRNWILAHNGTIFESEELLPYQYLQEGTTDSERILLYIVDEINHLCDEKFVEPTEAERIKTVEQAILSVVPQNKVNLMIYDGDLFFVHKNEEKSLYYTENEDGVVFSTKPLEDEGWKEVPQNRLFVYRDGDLIYAGDPHKHTYVHDEKRMQMLYFDYSGL